MADGRKFDRRRFVQGFGTSSFALLAGCLGNEDESEDTEDYIDPRPVSVAADTTWRTTDLADVRTEETFQLGAFDRPVVIHTFGVGCAVCHSQHYEFESLYEANTDAIEIVDLTTDVNAQPETIREYATEEGYDWRFAVATEAVIGSLSDYYTNQVTRSSSSPVVVDCPDGETYYFGKVADAEAIERVLGEYC